MFKSIAEQTGNFSYSIFVKPLDFNFFEVGFSGDSKLFSFSGESGKIYDNSSRFIYSYQPNQSINISGNKFSEHNSYWINDSIINNSNSQTPSNVKFFYSLGNSESNISFNGEIPNFQIGSGVFLNGATTGSIDITNLGDTSFKVYSGQFVGPSGQLFSFTPPFDSGDITSSKAFNISSTFSAGIDSNFVVPVSLITNFGNVSQNISIKSLYAFLDDLSLSGPPNILQTGVFDYSVGYDLRVGSQLSENPYLIEISFKNQSGIGEFEQFTNGTGFYEEQSDFEFKVSGFISNSGVLQGNYSIPVTGFNPFLNITNSGNSTGNFISSNRFATGEFSYSFDIAGTGNITGTISATINSLTGAYNFSQMESLLFTGQEFATVSFSTGLDYTGVFQNKIITVNNNVELTSVPQIGTAPSDSFINYNWDSIASGFGSGLITNPVQMPISQSEFSQEFLIGFTGELPNGTYILTGGPEEITGLTGVSTFSFGQNSYSWFLEDLNYTGLVTGEVTAVGATGLIAVTGITSFDTFYFGTGYSGIDYSYNFISETSSLTGYFDQTINITGNNGNNSLSLVPNNEMTGSFFHNVSSSLFTSSFGINNVFSFSIQNLDSISQTGFTYFTGDFSSSGTGIFLGHCEGNNYTGAGIIGNADEFIYTAISGERLFFAPESIANSFSIPVTGINTNLDSPYFISGNTGIALVSDFTNVTAPLLSFSTNDSNRGNNINNPCFFKYKWMDPSASKGRVIFSLSPRYFASGTGIYKSRVSVSRSISLYTGDTFGSLNYLGIGTSNVNQNTAWDSAFNSTLDNFQVQNIQDDEFWVLCNTSSFSNPEPSGFYFLHWRDNASNRQGNANKTYNTFFENEDYSFVPSGDFNEYKGGYVSQENQFPTGILSEGFFFNNNVNVKSGHSIFPTGVITTGIGYVENFEPTETGNIFQISGNITGGHTKTGFYENSEGSFISTVNTGSFSSNTIRLNARRNLRIEDDPFASTANNIVLGQYAINANFPTVESISGHIRDTIGHAAYFERSGTFFVVSGGNSQYLKLGFQIGSSNGFSTSLNSYFLDNTVVTPQFENVSVFGTGFQNSGNFESFTEGEFSGTGFISGEWIERDDIPARMLIPQIDIISNNVVKTVEFTGLILSTGLFTGSNNALVDSGNNFSNEILSFSDVYFTGNEDTIASPLIGLNVQGYQAILNNWNVYSENTVSWTGEKFTEVFFEGTETLTSHPSTFTGQVSGVGNLTGVKNIEIENGSGVYQFNEFVQEPPVDFNVFPSNVGITISGGVPVGNFTGFLNQLFIGSGFYEESVFVDLSQSGFLFSIPQYQKSFSGEYNFYSGLSTSSLQKIENFELNQFYDSISVTGQGNLILRVEKVVENLTPDILRLAVTGNSENIQEIIINE